MEQSRFTYFISFIIACFSVGLYFVPSISPVKIPFQPFITFSIPFVLLLNFTLFIYFLSRKAWIQCFLYILVIAVGGKFIFRTFSLGDFLLAEPITDKELVVLNYNVHIFNVYSYQKKESNPTVQPMIDYIIAQKADVVCLQEFYYNPTDPQYKTIDVLKKSYPYFSFRPFLNYRNQSFGMIILSKYPIVDEGQIVFRAKSNNQIQYVDIRYEHNRLIRCYNVHLQSMSIDGQGIKEAQFNQQGKNTVISAMVRYKNGAIQRAYQVDKLIAHFKKSKKPFLVVGDFNEIPYGYAYNELNTLLKNAFQNKGFGFDFTYNGAIPLLRIDSQFYTDDWYCSGYSLDQKNNYSDHFPMKCSYILK